MNRWVPPLLAVLAFLPAASGSVTAFDASAAGTTSFQVTDWDLGGQVTCSGGAAFVVEVNAFTGVASWASPECGGPDAAPFTYGCTDACFHDCWFSQEQVSCSNEVVQPDGTWTWDQMTLGRDGAFTFQRYVGAKVIEARGTLLVATWPDGA